MHPYDRLARRCFRNARYRPRFRASPQDRPAQAHAAIQHKPNPSTNDPEHRRSEAPIDRREFLRLAGAAGVTGVLTGAVACTSKGQPART
ncbi:MAG: twin-arginine translocation signal domain-containing protein, partial [bacterium]